MNRIEALFAFRDGRIVRHYDRFSFWRWSAQALGPAGRFLGWFAPLKWMVRRQAAAQLDRYREKRAAGARPHAGRRRMIDVARDRDGDAHERERLPAIALEERGDDERHDRHHHADVAGARRARCARAA